MAGGSLRRFSSGTCRGRSRCILQKLRRVELEKRGCCALANRTFGRLFGGVDLESSSLIYESLVCIARLCINAIVIMKMMNTYILISCKAASYDFLLSNAALCPLLNSSAFRHQGRL
jgi:hypothetical protein